MTKPYAIDQVAHTTLLGLAQQIMNRVLTTASRRRARRKRQADAALLAKMDPRLRDDIGAGSAEIPVENNGLSRLNPLVVAVTLYTTPRAGR
jgi:hypothetical protein